MKLNTIWNYCCLMRFHRPIGILLLLWPTLWALWIASDRHPNLKVFVVMTLGVIVMRAAGCVINDIADRNFDGFVARTKERPLVTGVINVPQALILFFILLLCAFCLVLLLNKLTIFLAFIAAGLAILYPFTKRFFILPQLILGAAFNWGIIMAFTAQTNTVPLIAWYLYGISFIWTLIYDSFYAMVDRGDDIKIGIKSSVILFGKADIVVIAVLQMIFLIALIFLGYFLYLPLRYYFCLALVVILFIYQQYLIRARTPDECFKAFLNSQWVGLIIFLGLL